MNGRRKCPKCSEWHTANKFNLAEDDLEFETPLLAQLCSRCRASVPAEVKRQHKEAVDGGLKLYYAGFTPKAHSAKDTVIGPFTDKETAWQYLHEYMQMACTRGGGGVIDVFPGEPGYMMDANPHGGEMDEVIIFPQGETWVSPPTHRLITSKEVGRPSRSAKAELARAGC